MKNQTIVKKAGMLVFSSKKMLKLMLIFFGIIIINQNVKASGSDSTSTRLKIFLDCQNTWCDRNFIKTEINVVDFLNDRLVADVHVLITSQRNGAGGNSFQCIFYGQNKFSTMTDTLKFSTSPTATEVEGREVFIKHLKAGLFPFILKTGNIDFIELQMKNESAGMDSIQTMEVDKWNYWVFNNGVNGSMDADQNYKSFYGGANTMINKTTDKIKIFINGYYEINSSTFNFYDGEGGTQSITVKNSEYGLRTMMAKSISDHFSIGYFGGYMNSTFSNTKGSALLAPAVEYNFFKYNEVNSRSATISYMPDFKYNTYYDTTIYNKTKEMLAGHTLRLNISYNQKWGQFSFGARYSNYFHDWRLNQLMVDAYINLRITGNLFMNMSAWGGLTHNQMNIAKGDSSSEEVLTRQRQLLSGFNIYSSMGFSYRFGSKVNNAVNPRFDSMF